MKVIIPPPDSTWRAQVTCQDCLALLEADASDLRYETPAPHPERGGGFAYVVCPVPGCHRVIPVSPPDRLMAKLRAGLPTWLAAPTGGGK